MNCTRKLDEPLHLLLADHRTVEARVVYMIHHSEKTTLIAYLSKIRYITTGYLNRKTDASASK